MRFILAIAAVALVATPVLAAETAATTTSAVVTPKRGATLRDAKGLRLGSIDRVNPDGSVQIIFNSKLVTIPADKLVASPAGAATSLTRSDVDRLP